jgi:copper resistance protein B
MNRRSGTRPAAYWPILALGLGLAVSFAFAQEDMPGMNMPDMQMPATKSRPKRPGEKRAAPASSSPAAAATGGTSMQGMDMPSMAGTKASPQSPAKSVQPSPGASSPNDQSMKGMDAQGMSVSSMAGKHPTQSAALQRLHFGNMIGERPRPEGLAGSAHHMPMSSMGHMDMSSMQGGAAPRDARNPDYSDGYGYTAMPGMAMSDHSRRAMLLLDQFEFARGNHGDNGAFLDGQFWYGADFNKLWIKSEGDYSHGGLEDLRTEALWSHAVTSYWDTQAGVRQDLGEGPGRTWAALGIQGLAPYWLDAEATLYIGESGRTAARLELEYEELLTQRLVLQPKIEMNLYGKDDPKRGIGSGLSDTEVALRLRYELEREFAPYLGVVWRQRYGRTADLARSQGRPASDLQFVAGLHVWF